jgi:hypothetical protein
MQNFLGRDGFVWWIGVVEDIADPETLGRCKVRVFGYHDNSTLIPTDHLPWATAIHSPSTPNLYASLNVGDWVFGFFLDSHNAQEPAIMGYIPTQKTPRNFNRVHTNGNSANTVCWQIANNYIEVVTQSTTESNGHITIHHSSGSEINISSNGAIHIYSANTVSVNANSLIAVSNTSTITSNSCNVNIRDNLSTVANNISFVANNNISISGKNVSTVANNVLASTGNAVNTTGNTISTSGSSVTIADSTSSLTPTTISSGLAAGLVFPTPPE